MYIHIFVCMYIIYINYLFVFLDLVTPEPVVDHFGQSSDFSSIRQAPQVCQTKGAVVNPILRIPDSIRMAKCLLIRGLWLAHYSDAPHSLSALNSWGGTYLAYDIAVSGNTGTSFRALAESSRSSPILRRYQGDPSSSHPDELLRSYMLIAALEASTKQMACSNYAVGGGLRPSQFQVQASDPNILLFPCHAHSHHKHCFHRLPSDKRSC